MRGQHQRGGVAAEYVSDLCIAHAAELAAEVLFPDKLWLLPRPSEFEERSRSAERKDPGMAGCRLIWHRLVVNVAVGILDRTVVPACLGPLQDSQLGQLRQGLAGLVLFEHRKGQ